MWKNEFDLYDLPASKFCRKVDGHAVFAKIVAKSLQHTLALLHDGKDFDGEVHLEPGSPANFGRDVRRWS